MIVPFLGGSVPARSSNVSVERTMNWYPSILAAANPKIPGHVVLYPTPGLLARYSLDASPIRGIFSQDGRLFAVAGASLYELFVDYTWTNRGSGMANDGYGVTIDSNGDAGHQLMIVTAGEVWIYDLLANLLSQVGFNAQPMASFAVLQSPTGNTATPGQQAGCDLAAGVYKVALVAVDAYSGVSLPSVTTSITVAAGGFGKIVLTYTAPSQFDHMLVYVSDVGGTVPDRYFSTTDATTYTITTLTGATLAALPSAATAVSFHVIQNAVPAGVPVVANFTMTLVAEDTQGGFTLAEPQQTIALSHVSDDLGTVTVSYVAPTGFASVRVFFSASGGGTPNRYLSYTSATTAVVSSLSAAISAALPTVANAYIYGNDVPGNYGGFVNGYFVALDTGASTFHLSDLANGLSWDAADAYQRNTASDKWLSMIIVRGQPWFLGSKTSDVYYNSGDALNPFVPVQGAQLQYGILAPRSLRVVDNTPVWLSQNSDGAAIVLRANGYQPQRISTDELEYTFQTYGTLTDAVGWTYQESGHTFYVLSFPTEEKTWVFDASTNLWHERGFWDVAIGDYTAYRPQSHVYAFGKHFVGDRSTGTIFEMSQSLAFDADGAVIRRMRRGQHICNEQLWQFINYVQVDVEAGQGTAAYPNPTMDLAWTDDGGHEWTADRAAQIGPRGAYKQRAMWRSCGRTRDRAWQLTCSDPIPWIVMGFYADMSQGAL